MGVPLFKYACTINDEVLLIRLNEIEQSNSSLNFQVLKTVPQNLIEPFLRQQEVVKEYLKETYDEDIEEYSIQNLNSLNEGLESILKKRFAIITNENNEIIARLDCTVEENKVRLETLYVSPEYRGKKLGLWLVGKLMLHCKEEFPDIKLFETNTDQNNDSALKVLNSYRFYVKYTIEQLIQNRN